MHLNTTIFVLLILLPALESGGLGGGEARRMERKGEGRGREGKEEGKKERVEKGRKMERKV